MPRLRTIAFVAFCACEGERARRPLVHHGAIDLTTVDVVARIRLGAHRSGLVMTVHDPAPELLELLELAGLTAIVRVPPTQSR